MALTVEDLKKYKMTIESSGTYIFSKDNWNFVGLKIYANGSKIYDKTGNWKMGPDFAGERSDAV